MLFVYLSFVCVIYSVFLLYLYFTVARNWNIVLATILAVKMVASMLLLLGIKHVSQSIKVMYWQPFKNCRTQKNIQLNEP